MELYYPFGLGMKGLDWTLPTNAKEDKFTFQSKEKQTDFDLNISDFEARGYDYQINRMWQMDPHEESYYSLSPYSFLGNNPLFFIDPTGKDVTETATGTSYTGVDAQNAFRQLKFQDDFNKKQRAAMVKNWETIDPTIAKENWVGKGHGRNAGESCFFCAKKQMKSDKNATATVIGGSTGYQLYHEDWGKTKKTASQTLWKGATDYMTGQLKSKKPVMVGLNFTEGHPGNPDKTTDHWVVVVGQGKDKFGVYFQYYDNFDGNVKRGTSGRLYLHDNNTYRSIRHGNGAPILEIVPKNGVILTTVMINQED